MPTIIQDAGGARVVVVQDRTTVSTTRETRAPVATSSPGVQGPPGSPASRLPLQTLAYAPSLAPNLNGYSGFRTVLAGPCAVQAPVGTPYDGQPLVLVLSDDGSPHALTFDPVYRVADSDIELPATTQPGREHHLGFLYNARLSTWDLLAATD